ncbi:hypothetical protein D6D18_04961 [Aureobasidium pullulans]|nr:hypothetical protein D6D18_04961 [Aureobasidium pullulans]
MPCQLRLPRLCDSRHTYHHTLRHAVTSQTALRLFQQVRHASDAAKAAEREAAREAIKEKARQELLRRLNQSIDPNDLSATLEAHRESNRASVIHQVPTHKSDPEVWRPNFLNRAPYRSGAPRPYEHRVTRDIQERDRSEQDTLAEFSETVAKTTNEDDAYQLKKMKDAALLVREQRAAADAELRNGQNYERWTKFLHEHEKPLMAEIPEYDPKDRQTFFDLIRRVYHIIVREQKKAKTLGVLKGPAILKGMASPLLLLYSSVFRPLMSLKGGNDPEPWNRRPKNKGYSHREWFDLEITKFAEWMQLTPSEKAARAKLTETLLELVPRAAPDTGAEPFGSQVTGLTMPNSDIDIRIYEPNFNAPRQQDQEFADKEEKHAWQAQQRAEKKARMIAHLSKVQSHLEKHPDFDQIEITESYYPLVKAVHLPTRLKVQVVATKPSDSSREAIKSYLEELPHLKPLFLLMKTTLNLRGLSDPWHGGFGSYSLFMMCVVALKSAPLEPVKQKPFNSISDDFLYILKFWSRFDTSKKLLTIEPLGSCQKKLWATKEEIEASKTDFALSARLRLAKPVAYKPYLLALQDPADPINDLGRSGMAISDLQKTLRKLHRDLIENLEDPARKKNPSALLKGVVGRCDRFFDEMRIPVDLWLRVVNSREFNARWLGRLLLAGG